jgi:hypothetical protein
MRLVLAMAAAVVGGAHTVGDLLAGMAVETAAAPGTNGARADAATLRLVGDPLAPLAGAAGAAGRAGAVVAPALDEPLEGIDVTTVRSGPSRAAARA